MLTHGRQFKMAVAKKAESGCGVVIQGVDRERRVTISRNAVLLKVGTATAAEMMEMCGLTGILLGSFFLQMSVSSEHQRLY